jgi:tRNA dimethylallyltransferase
VEASKRYTADKFRKDGHAAISKILATGKLPIVAGGTGFYIDALVKNIVYPDVKPNGELRKVLAQKSLLALLKILTKLDPERAKQMDPNNKVRIIRAIEIAKALGKVPKAMPNPLYDALMIGLDLPNDALRKNIKTRLDARLKKGMLTEVRNLHKNGLSWKRLEELGLEYQYAALYLQNKISKDQMAEGIMNGSWSLVRRQRAWFKRDASIVWHKPTEFKKILKESARFLGK